MLVPCTVSPSGLTHSKPRVSSPCFRDAASTAAEEKKAVVSPNQNTRFQMGSETTKSPVLYSLGSRGSPAPPRSERTAADGESPGNVVSKGQRPERLKKEVSGRQRAKRDQGSRGERSSGDPQQQCWPASRTTHGSLLLGHWQLQAGCAAAGSSIDRVIVHVHGLRRAAHVRLFVSTAAVCSVFFF